MPHNKITWISFFSLLFILISCKSGETDESIQPERVVKESNSELIETLFDQNTFQSDTVLRLLKELNMCDSLQKNLKNADTPACDPKFFRVIPYSKDENLEDAFMVLTRAGVHGYALRRLFVFQRVNGKLVQVNRFVANIIGKQKTQISQDDLILRFKDKDDNFFNCLYAWTQGKYQFRKVVQINDATVKPEFQDSMNVEISKMLQSNGMEI